jgi:hypothetical protein
MLQGMPKQLHASSPEQRCWDAQLRWSSRGEPTCKKNNEAVIAGVYIENRAMTFYRLCHDGRWNSSGVLHHDLPEQVIPCMFMFAFKGYAKVTFLSLSRERPEDIGVEGLAAEWRVWPLHA